MAPLFCQKKTPQERSAENIQSNQTLRSDTPAVSLTEDQLSSMSSGVGRRHHEAFDEPETFPAATPEEYRGGASGSLMAAPFDDRAPQAMCFPPLPP
jgi:hypothetical protein